MRLLSLLLFLRLFIIDVPAADCPFKETPQCAQYCVFHCCRLLGVPVSLPRVCELLPPKERGESLSEIGLYFENIGLKYSAENVSFDELVAGPFPVIAHVNVQREHGKTTSHYLVVESFGPSGLKIDDSKKRGMLSKQSFLEMWDGVIMRVFPQQEKTVALFSKKPSIKFDTLFIDGGDIPQTQDGYTYIFPFKNIGNTDLHVRTVKTDCSCTVANDFQKTLTPGQIGQIEIRYTFKNSRGNFKQTAAVMSDDPDFPVIILEMMGNGRQEVKIAPAEFMFGQVVQGDKAVATTLISYTGETPFNIKSASASLDAIKLAVKPLTPQLLKEIYPGSDGAVLSECTNRYLIEGYLDTSKLTIEQNKAELEITTNLPGAHVLKIPVRFELVNPIRLIPSKLFIGDISTNSSVKKTITIKSLRGSKIMIKKVDTKETGLQSSYSDGVSEELAIDFHGNLSKSFQFEEQDIEISFSDVGSPEVQIIKLPICGRK
jgi:hypothetical protein